MMMRIADGQSWALRQTIHDNAGSEGRATRSTAQSRLIGRSVDVLGIAFPAREHRIEVVPSVKSDHDEMARDEGHEGAHGSEMPDASEPKAAKNCGEPPKLYRLE